MLVFWRALQRYTSVPKVAFAFLLQAFESVVLDTQRKVKNPKLQNREALFLFILLPHLFSCPSAYFSPIFLKQGFVSFRLTLRLHLGIHFCFLISPPVQLRGTEIIEQSAVAPHSPLIWSMAIGSLPLDIWGTRTFLPQCLHHAARHSMVPNSRFT